MSSFRSLLLGMLLLPAAGVVAADPSGSLKVFVLAGQSNMEGKAKVSLLEHQVAQPATRPLFAPFRDGDRWRERDDVFIRFLERQGPLTVGYGSPQCIGPELQFGWTLGDRVAEPVLLIKAAWGGRSLWRDFRPPSAGLPDDTTLEKLLADARKRKPDATLEDIRKPFGASYRAMLDEVNGTIAELPKRFPTLAGRRPELAGFIWFQGWNDMVNPAYTAAYTTNLVHFIRDVRRDLKSAGLPFVIAQMGVDGTNASKGIRAFKDAQAAVMDWPEFRGNVALVKTDPFWDYAAEAVFKKGWRENLAEWNTVGSDYPYHYLGSPKTMCGIGRACAEAVLGLGGAAAGKPAGPHGN